MAYFFNHNHRLFYREEGNGELFIIIPGNTASSFHSKKDLHFFSRYFHAVSFDLWGTGNSDRLLHWPLDWWEQGAHDAVSLADHLGYEKIILLGYSGGGYAALITGAMYPKRVKAVITDSCIEKNDFSDAILGREISITKIIKQETSLAAVLNRMAAIPVMVAFWSAAHGKDWRQVVQADSEFLMAVGQYGYRPLAGKLNQIVCPVLLTASLADPLLQNVENTLIKMKAQINTCDVFLAAEGGHPLCWSKPAVFRQAVMAFLNSMDDER